MRLRHAALSGLVVSLGLSLTIGLGAGGTAAAPIASTSPVASAPDAPSDDQSDDDQNLAEQTLDLVQDLLDPSTDTAPAPADDVLGDLGGADLSLALTQLATQLDDLDNDDREAAEQILARPNGKKNCSDSACYKTNATKKHLDGEYVRIHYVNKPAFAPDGEVGDKANGVPGQDDGTTGEEGDFPGIAGNGIPDYVEAALESVDHVASTYAEAGYRTVLPDVIPATDTKPEKVLGGNELTDIYLAGIAAPGYGLYGYCTTDDPNLTPHGTTWGYCVLDNDYRTAEFGDTHTPIENLQVTAAHEYFHAVQFAYDIDEDIWLMEGTAAWAEDEVYDDINDNAHTFLRPSPLTNPQTPLNTFNNAGFHYGTWIFFRYLTEKYATEEGGMPVIMREMWETMSNSGPGAKSFQSIKAIKKALKKRDSSLEQEFLDFTVANRFPKQTYEEAAENDYPAAPLSKTLKLTAKKPTKSYSTPLKHLSGRHIRIKNNGAAGQYKLRLKFDLSARSTGARAVVVQKLSDGTMKRFDLTLPKNGDGRKVINFNSADVKWAEVTLVNTSSKRKHDGKQQVVKATLVKR